MSEKEKKIRTQIEITAAELELEERLHLLGINRVILVQLPHLFPNNERSE